MSKKLKAVTTKALSEEGISKESRKNIDKSLRDRRFRKYLIERNGVIEVAVFGVKGRSALWDGYANKIVFGWYDNPKELNVMLDTLDKDEIEYESVYGTFNRPEAEAIENQELNQLVTSIEVEGKTFKDKDIRWRTHLLVDIDPASDIRPAKKDDTQKCLEKGREIRAALRGLGFTSPIALKTGNGVQLLFPLQKVKANDDTERLLKEVYSYLTEYSDSNVKIDTSVKNASRYCRMPGTYNCKKKGESDEEFRECKVIGFPDKIQRLDYADLEKIVSQLPANLEKEKGPKGSGKYCLDVKKYCAHYGVDIVKTKSHGSLTLYCLRECIFDKTHGPNDAAIVQDKITGKLYYQCFHDSCTGKIWTDVRHKISGNAPLSPFFKGGGQEVNFRKPDYAEVQTLSLMEIYSQEYEDNPLIGNLIDRDETVIIYGPPGAGKSVLTNLLSLHGANGAKNKVFDVFDYDRRFSTLSVQAENPARQIKARSKLLIKHNPDLEEGIGDIHYLSIRNTGRISGQFSDPDFQKIIMNVITETNAELLIVDPLVEYTKGVGENSNDEMIVELSCLKGICEYTGTALILVHHTGKDGKRSRGASAIEGWADRIFRLEEYKKDGDEVIKVINEKNRNHEKLQPFSLKKTALRFERISGKTEDDSDQVVEALEALGGGAESQKALVEAVQELTGTSPATARRRIEAAVASGLIEKNEEGRSKGYKLVDRE